MLTQNEVNMFTTSTTSEKNIFIFKKESAIKHLAVLISHL